MREYKIIHVIDKDHIEADPKVQKVFELYEDALHRQVKAYTEQSSISQAFIIDYAGLDVILIQTRTADGLRVLNSLSPYSNRAIGNFRQVIIHNGLVKLLDSYFARANRKEIERLGILVTRSL